MNLQEVKATNVNINGLDFEIERQGTTAKRVTVKQPDGKIELVIAMSSYSCEVFTPAPPKMKKAYQLTVSTLGTEIKKIFDTVCEAESFAEKDGFTIDEYSVVEVEVLDV